MERVVGVCGVFFKARDSKALVPWYRKHLGVPVEPDQTYWACTSAVAGEQTVWPTFPWTPRTSIPAPPPSCSTTASGTSTAAGARVEDKAEVYGDLGRFG